MKVGPKEQQIRELREKRATQTPQEKKMIADRLKIKAIGRVTRTKMKKRQTKS